MEISMDRKLMAQLVAWKSERQRKPLIINGARQVGKTWLLREFGRLHFANIAYISLDNNSAARELFENDYETQRIITGLSLLTDQEIVPGKTLIVLDEIQAAPKAITSLKYLCENASQYAVAAAGSLLGLSAHEGTGFPVGKVSTLDLFPLSFLEFLQATSNQRFAELIESGDMALANTFSSKLIQQLKIYYVVGGMPAVVANYIENESFEQVRNMQDQILGDYARDFTKHVPTSLLQKTIEAWDSVPIHLSEENKKFIFGRIRQGARAKEYETTLLWLNQAGLIHRVDRVTKPGIPLKAYTDNKAFKIFMLDIGLLSAASGLPPVSVVEGNQLFTEFKGALTEQFVCQELISSCGLQPYYWSAENSRGEIDFLVQNEGKLYPIEVKAEENLRSKSLSAFSERYGGMNPRRFSLAGYRDEGWMRNVPLYAIGSMANWA